MATVDSRRVADGSDAGGTFQPYLDSLRQELQQRDPTVLSVVLAVAAVLLTLGKEARWLCGCGAGRIRAPAALPQARMDTWGTSGL